MITESQRWLSSHQSTSCWSGYQFSHRQRSGQVQQPSVQPYSTYIIHRSSIRRGSQISCNALARGAGQYLLFDGGSRLMIRQFAIDWWILKTQIQMIYASLQIEFKLIQKASKCDHGDSFVLCGSYLQCNSVKNTSIKGSSSQFYIDTLLFNLHKFWHHWK